MSAEKSTRQAIDDFVDAIAQQYVGTHAGSGKATDESAEQFLSAIEHDLRSTLRERRSMLETAREVEETPTIDHRSSASSTGASRAISGLDAEIGLGLTGKMDEAIAAVSFNGSEPQAGRRTSGEQLELPLDQQRTVFTPYTDSENVGAAVGVPADYEILGTLGRGGMGVVYKARHVPLNRLVAIKMILSGQHASSEQRRRFQAEAEAAAHLTHLNIVSVYEVGEHNGMPYFSLEYIDGQTMSRMMRETTMSAQAAAALLIPIARAIDYSHSMGVLHRDLKPQNILITSDGDPKVADFGLAKRLDDEGDDLTTAGAILGTPGYMSPEQARGGQPVGPPADVYALGGILYYAMTGRPPFVAPTPYETVQQLLQSDPLAPSKLHANLDNDLETICLKSLEKDADRRYATAGEFADELQRFLDGKPIVARPITPAERVLKWCRRNRRVAAVSGLAAGLLLCLLFGGIISAVVINEQKKAEQFARADAEQNAKLADDQSELALDTTRMVLYQTKQFFDGKPELRPLRETMMQSVLASVEKLHTDRYENDPRPIFVASAESQLGQVYLKAGAFEQAKEKLLAAEAKLRELDADGALSNADISQMDLSIALGDTYRGLGQLERAKREYLRLLKLRVDYFRRNPQFSGDLASTSLAEVYGKLSRISSSLGKPAKALEYGLQATETRRAEFDRDPAKLQAQMELAGALSLLSSIYEKAGETENMLATSTEMLQLQQQIAQRSSDVATLHNNAKDQKVVARQYVLLGKDLEAKELLASATATVDDLVARSDDRRILSNAIDTYYWQGITFNRLGENAEESFERAESLQRRALKISENTNNRGMLLKILARGGKTAEAIQIADDLAGHPDEMMNCGYAGCGYALLSVHLAADDPLKAEVTAKSIEMIRLLIRHGYHDFDSLRTTDLDFAPLQQNAVFLDMLSEQEAEIFAAK